MIDTQLVALFLKVIEPLGGAALLKEVRHWGWDLTVDSLDSLPVHSISSELDGNVISLLPALPSSSFSAS